MFLKANLNLVVLLGKPQTLAFSGIIIWRNFIGIKNFVVIDLCQLVVSQDREAPQKFPTRIAWYYFLNTSNSNWNKYANTKLSLKVSLDNEIYCC